MKADDPRHGTKAGYMQGCRCEPCRAGNAAYARTRRALTRGSLAAGDPRHGTANGYTNYGCRCDPCTAAGYRERGNVLLRMADRIERGLAAKR